MSDLVQRLRYVRKGFIEPIDNAHAPTVRAMAGEAADEIDRLRCAIATFQLAAKGAMEERDSAREAARWCYARLQSMWRDEPDAMDRMPSERWPWLEEE